MAGPLVLVMMFCEMLRVVDRRLRRPIVGYVCETDAALGGVADGVAFERVVVAVAARDDSPAGQGRVLAKR